MVEHGHGSRPAQLRPLAREWHGDLNEHAKKYNLQTFFPAVNPLALCFAKGSPTRRRSWTCTRTCCCRAI